MPPRRRRTKRTASARRTAVQRRNIAKLNKRRRALWQGWQRVRQRGPGPRKGGRRPRPVRVAWPVRRLFPWWPWNGRGCSEKEICRYLEELGTWLQEHFERNGLLEEAVCNLEDMVFDNIDRGKFWCAPGGPGEEYGEKPPPQWP